MAFQPEAVKESQGDGKVSVQLVSRCIISGQTAYGLPHSHQSPYEETSV